MAGWNDLHREEPEIASAGVRLLTGGPAYLATVRKDGGPRVHPVMPVVAQVGLYVFVVNLGWKYHDLVREGRYALHSAPPPEGGEEFYVTGPASESKDPEERAMVRAACDGRLCGHDFEALFQFDVERALHTQWANWGTAEAWPTFRKWAAR